MAYFCNPSSSEWRQKAPTSSPARHPRQNGKLHVQQETLFQKVGLRGTEDDTDIDIWPLYTKAKEHHSPLTPSHIPFTE